MRQCPVCGQQIPENAPYCPQCGSAMGMLMKAAPLMTGAKWTDVLIGTVIGFGLVTTFAGVMGYIASLLPALWLLPAAGGVILYVAAYFLIRRYYPFVARGAAIAALLIGLLILGIFVLCSGFRG